MLLFCIILNIISILLLITINKINTYVLQIHNYPNEGETLTRNFIHNNSVVELTADICSVKDEEFCFFMQDKVSYSLYGVTYTPILFHATVEDYYTNRSSLIIYLQNRFNYKSYLEIGCGNNATFERLSPLFDISLGVDPYMGGNIRLTSDAFFSINKILFDIIFIDGLHEATQVLKDVDNALKYLTKDGVILIHDCHPHAESHQVRYDDINMNINLWTGDVWKAIVILKLYDYLDIIVGDFDMGIAIVKFRNNTSRYHEEFINYLTSLPNPGEIINDLQYSLLQNNRATLLQLKTMDEIKKWL